MRLPRAYRSLPRPSSLLKPSNPPIGVITPALFSPILHDYALRSLQVLWENPLHPSYITFMMHCIDDSVKIVVHPDTISFFFSKEVIQPQVPLRSPCYDFSLVAYLKFDNAKMTSPR